MAETTKIQTPAQAPAPKKAADNKAVTSKVGGIKSASIVILICYLFWKNQYYFLNNFFEI